MPYSAFTTLAAARDKFQLSLVQNVDLFPDVAEVAPTEVLRTIMVRWAPLARNVSTEKARSEWIVAPMLIEAWKLSGERFGLFSGIDFDVDAEQGLSGFCDFVLTRSPDQFVIESPVLAVVEAKNESIKGGLGQCIAEMVAAQLFNRRRGDGPTTTFGVVTTGDLWRFLKLEGRIVFVDTAEYQTSTLGKILGIVLEIAGVGPMPAPVGIPGNSR